MSRDDDGQRRAMADGGGPAHVVELGPSGDPSTDEGELRFIGTATVLLRCDGFTVLTDPNFLHQGQHAKLGYGLRSRRLTEPAAQVADLTEFLKALPYEDPEPAARAAGLRKVSP